MKHTNRLGPTFFVCVFAIFVTAAQDYFFKDKAPFDPKIPSPEDFLGYPIGQ